MVLFYSVGGSSSFRSGIDIIDPALATCFSVVNIWYGLRLSCSLLALALIWLFTNILRASSFSSAVSPSERGMLVSLAGDWSNFVAYWSKVEFNCSCFSTSWVIEISAGFTISAGSTLSFRFILPTSWIVGGLYYPASVSFRLCGVSLRLFRDDSAYFEYSSCKACYFRRMAFLSWRRTLLARSCCSSSFILLLSEASSGIICKILCD